MGEGLPQAVEVVGAGFRRVVAKLRLRDKEGLSEKQGRPDDMGHLHHVEA